MWIINLVYDPLSSAGHASTVLGAIQRWLASLKDQNNRKIGSNASLPRIFAFLLEAIVA